MLNMAFKYLVLYDECHQCIFKVIKMIKVSTILPSKNELNYLILNMNQTIYSIMIY